MKRHHVARRLILRLRGESGSIAPMVPILVLAFLVLGGLIVDGSRELNARGEAQAYAEEAARAGATAVDLRQPVLVLNTRQAAMRVARYCRTARATNHAVQDCRLARHNPFTDAPTCSPVDGKPEQARIVVNTVVTTQIHTTLLDILGFGTLGSTGVAKARPYQGTPNGRIC